MKSGSSPRAPRYWLAEVRRRRGARRLRGAAVSRAAAAADAGGRLDAVPADARDHLLHRAARRRLHDDEVDQHDAEERRDDQEEAAEDIGEHRAATVACSAPRPRAPPPSAASTHQVSKPSAYFGTTRGPAELVPVGDAEGLDVPVRDHVVAPQEHAVERARARDQARAVGRGDHQLDQRSTTGSLMPARLRLPGRPRSPTPQKSRCSLPGRQRLSPDVHDHVEVEVVESGTGTGRCPRCGRARHRSRGAPGSSAKGRAIRSNVGDRRGGSRS